MKPWTSESEVNPKDTNLLFQKTTPGVFNIIDVVIIGVGSSLAVGSSVLIGEITKCVAGPAVVVSIFLAGVIVLFGGLCLAEFGVQFHKVDSAYPYSYCWGRSTEAFIFGWALILQHVAGTASVAKGILSFTDALTDNKISNLLKNTTATPYPDVFPYFDYFSTALILLITFTVSFGLKDSTIVKKLFTVCSVVLFITVIIAGALRADVKNWESEDGFAPFGGLGVVKAAGIAVYGFIGFESFSCTGNEIKKRKINLPLGILSTIFITLVIFSGIGVVLTLMLPYTKLNSFAAVPFAFQHVELFALKWVAIVATFLAFLTSFFGVVFPLSRIIHTMANDGLLFHWLGNDHRRFKTPIWAIITGGLLAAAAAGIFTFQTLANVAVIAALFVYTILAFNVIILRYFPKFEDNQTEFWRSLLCNNPDVSLKAVMQNYFNFKEKQPTNLTKAIIMGNLVLFCICSIGLGIIFNILYEFLVRCTAEAVVPASLLLCVMFFNIISMCCQPKSQEVVPFKVPLFPFIPCFSIFLNVFLMMSFDSITWILFSSWMIVGVLPYFIWHFWKLRKGELGKISLYEINSTNAIKLNESIWKIKSDKKSFYEGAVNPVFMYDFDDNPDDEKDVNAGVKEQELKQDEIIQRADSVVEKKPEHLNHELQLNFIPEDIDDNLEDENEKVHWECVAEIHTEEEFSPESVALEIVDNNYNFLSEESEEMFKDDINGDLIIKPKSADEEEKKSSKTLQLSETNNEHPDSKNKIEIYHENISETETGVNSNNNEQNELINNGNIEKKLPAVLQENKKNENQLDTLFIKSSDPEEIPFIDKNQNDEKLVYLIVETFYEAQQSEMISRQNNAISNTAAKPVLDEQNKIKDFKEKLNQLLKNQINNAVVLTKDASLSKSDDSNNSEINKNVIHNSFKTLNKSQIKDKLELLLAKKPSQRPSLKSSFNINLKETENENTVQKINEEDTQNSKISNGSETEESYVKPSPALVNSIKEKILSLKNIDNVSSDICC